MTTPSKYDVFLSYSSKDKAKVQKLVNRLRKEGISIWWDEEQIEPGDPIVEKIQTGLASSKYLVLALSHIAGESPWCRREYASILHREIKESMTRVIPVMLEAMDDQDIPPLLYDKYRVDISKDDDFRRLVEKIQGIAMVDKYRDWVLEQPLLSIQLFNGYYHVEPADLMPIELREVSSHFEDPFRAIQEGHPVRAERTRQGVLTLEEFIHKITNADEVTSAKVGQPTKVWVVLGEAGVGKTITCKWLRRTLLTKGKLNSLPIPVYVPLGEWNGDDEFRFMLDQQVNVGTLNELSEAAGKEGRQLILFLDGWNELDSARLETAWDFAWNQVKQTDANLVLTSRPVAAANTIWGRIPNIRTFELQRWTLQQLERYFEKNKRGSLLPQVPNEVRNCLRLPLLSFLLIKRLSIYDLDAQNPLPDLDTMASVFEEILNHLLDLSEDRGRNLPRVPAEMRNRLELSLRKLAYQMTKDKAVHTEGSAFESILLEPDRKHFKLFLAHLVNSGLLRCSNTEVALDLNASPDELRSLKIGFLHQSFQEYLTAQWILSRDYYKLLPPNVSHDAFWRDIPVYMIQSQTEAVHQKEFSLSFIKVPTPDYLTSARLVHEIRDLGTRANVEETIINALISSIEMPKSYPYSIEAFQLLGARGQVALRECLNSPSLKRVIAVPEKHLVERSEVIANEQAWCRLGRSIYFLGELGDFWLVNHLGQHLDFIASLHLLYHVGEALLTLVRSFDLPVKEHEILHKQILDIGFDLERLDRDPITVGYACAIIRECGQRAVQQDQVAGELDRLLRRQDPENPYFDNEFWRRAHGVEALAEIAEPDKCEKVGMVHFP